MTNWIEFSLQIDGKHNKADLAYALAALSAGCDVRFGALRPHQAPAWNAFLVQLATMALDRAGKTLEPFDPTTWRGLLVDLANADQPGSGETAFALIAASNRPAFFQAPTPDGLSTFKNSVTTPDQLDMLVTSKNHDLKAARMLGADDEDWAFALMSLQTQEGFLGRGNYGIARMNGGFAARPFVGLQVSANTGVQFCRDVSLLLANIDAMAGFFSGHVGLTWIRPWDGVRQFAINELHPLCLEICRRVRLERDIDGRIFARVGNSEAARIATPPEFKGDTSDPWTPVLSGEGKSLSLSSDGYSWRVMCKLLFGNAKERWAMPLLAKPQKADGRGILVLQCAGIARGQGKTEGYHSRAISIPPARHAILEPGSDDHAAWALAAKNHQEDAATMARKVLRFALMCGFQKGRDQVRLDARESGSAADQILHEHFDPFVDRNFFEFLLEGPDQPFEERQLAWQQALKVWAERALHLGLANGPQTEERRFWAEAHAQSAFNATLYKNFENLRAPGLAKQS
ncbi:hypothetical protein [Aquidulcibacter paucihalophilus]|uniref:hypothetical protein n=1 Tax=Aquidulcibacter paucihalophilus TaxID=1978549 RepID=UPI000A190CC3|nr:hypothetical protein [Aquidulcibacter paucihalophilus]